MPFYDYKCEKCGVVEIFHGMMDDNYTICPECNNEGLIKIISSGGAVIIAGREANQYSDIKAAKYWRDKNGVRHRVRASDGYSTSSTVKRQTVSPEEAKRRRAADHKSNKDERLKLQKIRADNWNKQNLK